MDRRELADIGLSPTDVRDASALALDGDPTELLERRARERRENGFGPPPSRAGRSQFGGSDGRPGRNRPAPRQGANSAGKIADLVRTG
jgi:hypothetical protein